MTWALAATARNAGLAAILGLVDGGPAAGTMQIRTGAKPSTPQDTASGTLLATVTFQDPAFGSPTAGSAAVSDPAAVTAVATGTAGWCRIADSTGAAVMDGTVTATGGGGDLTLASTSISSGQTIDITGGSIVMPQGG